VAFLPFQPYRDLPSLLAASDVLLVPLDKEKSHLSVPSKLYNFMAAGRPILGLATPDSEVAAVIRDTGCGLTAPPDDAAAAALAVLALERPEEVRQAMAARGRAYVVDRFSKPRILSAYDNLLCPDGAGPKGRRP
jgi:glycosyltransferase involved in cell wall biosynthesis